MTMNKYTLLDRKTFYSDLVSEINQARKFIIIDSFIWICDGAGKRITKALFDAANNEVKIIIRNDIFGSLFEHTPNRIPMFYDNSYYSKGFVKTIYNQENGFLTMKNFNRLGYFVYGCKKRPKIKICELSQKLSSHKNTVVLNLPLFNHGKVIIVDGKIAYIGGQCLSDDYEKWIDYNQKVNDPGVVKKIALKLLGKNPSFKKTDSFQFVNNDKLDPQKTPSIHDFLKSFIVSAKNDLYIEMGYLGEWYIDAINTLLDKKINVYLLAPTKADANQHTNMLFLTKLLKNKGNSPYLHVALHDNPMPHTKGLVTKHKVTLGSTNFFSAVGNHHAVDEHNLYSTNPQVISPILNRFKGDFKQARKVTNTNDLPKYSLSKAHLEKFGTLVISYLIKVSRKRIMNSRIKAREILKNSLEIETKLQKT